MRLSVREVGGQAVLAGAADGLAARSRALRQLAIEATEPVVFLDFAGVSVATASFLREFVFGLRESLRSEREVQLVVANIAPSVEDELRVVLQALNTAVVVCEISADDHPSSPRLVGSVEPAERRALVALIDAGEADASSLLERAGEQEAVGITAWNNRLAALKEKGVVIEARRGRQKIYRPVIGGLNVGS